MINKRMYSIVHPLMIELRMKKVMSTTYNISLWRKITARPELVLNTQELFLYNYTHRGEDTVTYSMLTSTLFRLRTCLSMFKNIEKITLWSVTDDATALLTGLNFPKLKKIDLNIGYEYSGVYRDSTVSNQDLIIVFKNI